MRREGDKHPTSLKKMSGEKLVPDFKSICQSGEGICC
jgi:hypothetical protein